MSEKKSDLIVTDTSALVSYFKGSARGKKAKPFIENYSLIVPAIVIAELSDYYHRIGEGLIWQQKRKPYLELTTMIYPLEVDLADRAGKIKTEKRKNYSGFSLADGIIIATAQHAGAKILTADNHLRGKDTILLT